MATGPQMATYIARLNTEILQQITQILALFVVFMMFGIGVKKRIVHI